MMSGYEVVRFESLGSTNDEAMSHTSYTHGTIILAQNQSAGRGQRGNIWQSNPGENLTFSLVLEPVHIPVYEQFRLSIMAALAASDALRELGVSCCVKWPNDLYVGDKKIGGILIEHNLQGEFLTRTVIGIGINVAQREFPASLPNPTSVTLELIDANRDATAELGVNLDVTAALSANHEVDTESRVNREAAAESGVNHEVDTESRANRDAAAEFDADCMRIVESQDVLMRFCGAFGRRYGQSVEQLSCDYHARLWRGAGELHDYLDTANGEWFRARIDRVDPRTGMMTLCRDSDGAMLAYWFKEVEFCMNLMR